RNAEILFPDVAALHPGYKPSDLDRFERGGGARSQESDIAANGEEAHAALGERDRALDRVAIGAHDLAGLARRRQHAVDPAVDFERHRIDVAAVAERDREVSRPEEERIDTGG